MLHRIALAVILCTAMLAGTASRALAEKDKIEGFWYNEEQTAKVQIYKAIDGKFWGKIVWLKEPVRMASRARMKKSEGKIPQYSADQPAHSSPFPQKGRRDLR